MSDKACVAAIDIFMAGRQCCCKYIEGGQAVFCTVCSSILDILDTVFVLSHTMWQFRSLWLVSFGTHICPNQPSGALLFD